MAREGVIADGGKAGGADGEGTGLIVSWQRGAKPARFVTLWFTIAKSPGIAPPIVYDDLPQPSFARLRRADEHELVAQRSRRSQRQTAALHPPVTTTAQGVARNGARSKRRIFQPHYGALVLDFLCIHPFRDGNGRVSRLLMLLALCHHGYEIGRYISLERLIEESKEDYYHVLQQNSRRWHDGKHEFLPWLNYFLAIVRRGYTELEQRAGEAKSRRGAKSALVESALESFPGDFTLADVEGACPGVSRDLIRRLLWQRQKAGQLECLNRGPGAVWRKKVKIT
jgi:hypothetical protein